MEWLLIFLAVVPSAYAASANVTVDYIKVGACNSSIVVRVGQYQQGEILSSPCEHAV